MVHGSLNPGHVSEAVQNRGVPLPHSYHLSPSGLVALVSDERGGGVTITEMMS